MFGIRESIADDLEDDIKPRNGEHNHHHAFDPTGVLEQLVVGIEVGGEVPIELGLGVLEMTQGRVELGLAFVRHQLLEVANDRIRSLDIDGKSRTGIREEDRNVPRLCEHYPDDGAMDRAVERYRERDPLRRGVGRPRNKHCADNIGAMAPVGRHVQKLDFCHCTIDTLGLQTKEDIGDKQTKRPHRLVALHSKVYGGQQFAKYLREVTCGKPLDGWRLGCRHLRFEKLEILVGSLDPNRAPGHRIEERGRDLAIRHVGDLQRISQPSRGPLRVVGFPLGQLSDRINGKIDRPFIEIQPGLGVFGEPFPVPLSKMVRRCTREITKRAGVSQVLGVDSIRDIGVVGAGRIDVTPPPPPPPPEPQMFSP